MFEACPACEINLTIHFIRIKKLMLLSARKRDACMFEDEAGRFDHWGSQQCPAIANAPTLQAKLDDRHCQTSLQECYKPAIKLSIALLNSFGLSIIGA